MHPLDDLKAWVGFTAADAEALSRAWPAVEPRLEAVVDAFYEAVLASPAASVLTSEAQVARLRTTLAAWLKELHLGPFDASYHARRERIGRVHVDVGLPARFVPTAMSVVRRALGGIARSSFDAPTADGVCAAIDKITSIDLAIMTDAFVDSRARADLATVQELIVAHLPSCVVLLDDQGRITAATRSRWLRDGAVGRRWQDALPAPLVDPVASAVADALARGTAVVLARTDGLVENRLRSFRTTVVPLDHPLARLLVHVEDLTDAVEAEARVRQSESLASLGALSAAVAHELRNPLAGISAALQVISRGLPPGDPRRTVMEKVDAQLRRLDALSSDLLAFASPDLARPVAVDLGEQVRVAAASSLEPWPDVRLEIRGVGRALADPALMNQLLGNLLENAAQAMDGEGRIAAAVSDGLVVISDSGPGIAEEIRGEIFKPFFTTRTRGTGLGLAIVAKAAASMGGSVSLAPGELPGAAFAVRLPCG